MKWWERQAWCIDLDGTLTDTIPFLYQLYKDFLGRYGIEGSKREFQELNGPSFAEVVTILKQRYSIEGDVETLMESYRGQVGERYAHEVELMPDAAEALVELKAAGRQLALVTSAHAELAGAFMQAQGIAEGIFDALVTGDDVKRSKPHPAIYRKALDLLEVDPAQAVAIEDAPHGVTAARAAGMAVVYSDSASGSQGRRR